MKWSNLNLAAVSLSFFFSLSLFFGSFFNRIRHHRHHDNATTKTIGGHAEPEIAQYIRELEGVLAPRETHVPLQPVRIQDNDEIDGSSNVCIVLGRKRVGTWIESLP